MPAIHPISLGLVVVFDCHTAWAEPLAKPLGSWYICLLDTDVTLLLCVVVSSALLLTVAGLVGGGNAGWF
jgi:hypothetical protein